MFDATLTDIANRLVQGCREGREAENLDALYAEDAVSVEAADMMGTGRETHGREGIRAKHAWWDGATEVHELKTEGPLFHGDNQFGVVFHAHFTMKESGEEMRMTEIAIYTVRDARIVREEFFFEP